MWNVKAPSEVWSLELNCQAFEQQFSRLRLSLLQRDYIAFRTMLVLTCGKLRKLSGVDLDELRVDHKLYDYRIRFYKNTQNFLESITGSEFYNKFSAIEGYLDAAQKIFKYISTTSNDLDFTKIMNAIHLYNMYGSSISTDQLRLYNSIMEVEILTACTNKQPDQELMDLVFDYYGQDQDNWVWTA